MNSALSKTITFLCALAFIGACLYYWYKDFLYPSTEDAYVQADIIRLAPNVSGTVESVLIKDNDFVKKGQLLYQIDKRPFMLALEKANVDLELARQARAALFENVETAKGNIAKANATLNWAEKNYRRMRTLAKQGRASLSDGDKARSEYLIAKATLVTANSQFSEALVKLGSSETGNASIKQAKTEIKQAKLNLEYTKIHAPIDGLITHLNLKPGDMALSGQSNLTIIDPSRYWVEANFKETQLKRLRKGQAVSLTLEMYPDRKMRGTIESISASTGQTFALIPQENSGGNWVKVIQRVPVIIAISDAPAPPILRVGASVNVEVNTYG